MEMVIREDGKIVASTRLVINIIIWLNEFNLNCHMIKLIMHMIHVCIDL